MSSWTFGRKVALGFALAFATLLVIGLVSYRSISVLAASSYSVARAQQVLEAENALLGELKDAETGQRGFVITGDDSFLAPHRAAVAQLPKTIADLRELLGSDSTQLHQLEQVAPLITSKLAELQQVIDVRRASGFEAAQKIVGAGQGKRDMDEIRRMLGEVERAQREVIRQRGSDVESAVASGSLTILLGTALCLALVILVAVYITRSLTSQIGAAVQHVQSSSAELQTASNQQATGAKEQATAMTEITTTINELLATSRQIAESAQRVAHIAEDTAKSARSGELGVSKTTEAIVGIQKQVDLIVAHMLDLGKKSQQIGGILEIINELAEQTNILAINATIEAAGAGEAGKRFAVVADEIRKLADRVGGSTKEIRALIDEIRAAVNATVMTTEGGTKAVDAGARQFGDVATSFRSISTMVATTTEAAREIELSTKQQSTAVEQVNVAISNVAQAARETEASSTQTFQTASELTRLSRELLRLIQPQAAA